MGAEADKSKVVATHGGAAAGGVTVHHRDFPEIRGAGASTADAAGMVANQLTRTLDSAPTPERRQAIHEAIADVRAFADQPK